VFLGLLYTSYTDFKYREVSNFVSFGMILFGLLLAVIDSVFFSDWRIFISTFLFTIIVFFICYFCWHLGIFAGGDAKLYTGIAALIPSHTFSFFGNALGPKYLFVLSIFLLTAIVSFPYGATLGLLALIKKKALRKYLLDELIIKSKGIVESCALVVSLYLVLSYFSLPLFFILPISLISGFVPKIVKLPFLIITFPIAMYIEFYQNLKLVVFLVVISYVLWAVFKLFFLTKTGILNYTKKVRELREGDLLAKPLALIDNKPVFYDAGLFSKATKLLFKAKFSELRLFLDKHKHLNKQIVINNRLASGLSEENISELKKYLKPDDYVELKQTLALVPATLCAFCLMVLFGDIIWLILKSF